MSSFSELDENSKASLKSAFCACQKFLSDNGYLEQRLLSEPQNIRLEMWDDVKYNQGGVFDWERLFADRAGSFVGRAYGVKDNGDEQLVYYQFEDSFRCVSVNLRNDEIALREANCLQNDKIIRFSATIPDCSLS